MSKICLGLSLFLASSPAWAASCPTIGCLAPAPEIGAGIPFLALIVIVALIAGTADFRKRVRK